MLSLLVILASLVFSWFITDLGSDSIVGGMLGPLGIFLSFIALAIWIVFFMHNAGIKQTFSGSSGESGFGGFGDGGGGDGC